jgi:hypothetical protein
MSKLKPSAADATLTQNAVMELLRKANVSGNTPIASYADVQKLINDELSKNGNANDDIDSFKWETEVLDLTELGDFQNKSNGKFNLPEYLHSAGSTRYIIENPAWTLLTDAEKSNPANSDQRFIKINDATPGNIRFISHPMLASVNQEFNSCAAYLDSKRTVVDWETTIKNLQTYSLQHEYSVSMIKSALIHLIRYFQPADEVYLSKLSATQIAQHLLRASRQIDKRTYHLEKLRQVTRLPTDSLQQAMSKFDLVLNSLFGQDEFKVRKNLQTKALVSFIPDPMALEIYNQIKRLNEENKPLNIQYYIDHVTKYEKMNNIKLAVELTFDRKLNDKSITFMNMQLSKEEEDINKKRLLMLGVQDMYQPNTPPLVVPNAPIMASTQRSRSPSVSANTSIAAAANTNLLPDNQFHDTLDPKEVIFHRRPSGHYDVQFCYNKNYYSCPLRALPDAVAVKLVSYERHPVDRFLQETIKQAKRNDSTTPILSATYQVNRLNPDNYLTTEIKAQSAQVADKLNLERLQTRSSSTTADIVQLNNIEAAASMTAPRSSERSRESRLSDYDKRNQSRQDRSYSNNRDRRVNNNSGTYRPRSYSNDRNNTNYQRSSQRNSRFNNSSRGNSDSRNRSFSRNRSDRSRDYSRQPSRDRYTPRRDYSSDQRSTRYDTDRTRNRSTERSGNSNRDTSYPRRNNFTQRERSRENSRDSDKYRFRDSRRTPSDSRGRYDSRERRYATERQSRYNRSNSARYNRTYDNSKDRQFRNNRYSSNENRTHRNRSGSFDSLLTYKQQFPNMVLGYNCRRNYDPERKYCTKCLMRNHHEFACKTYNRINDIECNICRAGFHRPEECREKNLFPPVANFNTIIEDLNKKMDSILQKN